MDDPEGGFSEHAVENSASSEKQLSLTPSDTPKSVAKSVKSISLETAGFARPTVSSRKKMDPRSVSDSNSSTSKSAGTPLGKTANSVPPTRRNSTGGLAQKTTPLKSNVGTAGGKKGVPPSAPEAVRRSLPELRRTSLPSVVTKPTASRASVSDTKSAVVESLGARGSRTTTGAEGKKQGTMKQSAVNGAAPASSPSVRRVASTSVDSVGSGGTRKTVSKVSSSSARTPSRSSGLKTGSLSSSIDRSSSLSARRRTTTPDSKDSKFMMLPQVELKASDDVVRFLLYDAHGVPHKSLSFHAALEIHELIILEVMLTILRNFESQILVHQCVYSFGYIAFYILFSFEWFRTKKRL